MGNDIIHTAKERWLIDHVDIDIDFVDHSQITTTFHAQSRGGPVERRGGEVERWKGGVVVRSG